MRDEVQVAAKILNISRFMAIPVGLLIGFYTLTFTIGMHSNSSAACTQSNSKQLSTTH